MHTERNIISLSIDFFLKWYFESEWIKNRLLIKFDKISAKCQPFSIVIQLIVTNVLKSN